MLGHKIGFHGYNHGRGSVTYQAAASYVYGRTDLVPAAYHGGPDLDHSTSGIDWVADVFACI